MADPVFQIPNSQFSIATGRVAPQSFDRAGSTCAGDEAILEFTGVAVALVGRPSPEGGRAEVYLDGQKVGAFDAYVAPRTRDNARWHTYGLESGPHTLRIVTTGMADPRSTGRRVPIERAIVYR